MQATARRLSVVSATSCARRCLIRDVRPDQHDSRNAMITDLNSLRAVLAEIDAYDDDIQGLSCDLLEQFNPSLGAAVCPVLFAFFEAHPGADVGTPGPFIHHIESFYPDYLPELRASLSRTPSRPAVTMLHRLLNSADLADALRAELMTDLSRMVHDEHCDDAVADLASFTLEHHPLPA